MKELSYSYGKYILKLDYRGDNFAQVSMNDKAAFQFPLIWSLPMNHEQANKAIEKFKKSGFFNFDEIEHL